MLIIKCWMLKVKHLTLLSQKKKKGGEFYQGCQKIELLQPSVAF